VLSLLYPFRVSFYASLGYTLAGELHHHRFAPADLPLHPGWERVLGVEKSEERAVRALYDRVAARGNGMLARKRGAWRMVFRAGTTLYAYRTEDGEVTGYLAVLVHKVHPPTLAVREMVWENDESYRAMLGWLSAQRDQYARVRYDALPCEALERHLPHPAPQGARSPRGGWVGSARILVGPMLRVLDVGALQEVASGAAVDVEDPELPNNHGCWRGGERLEPGAVGGAPALGVAAATEAFLSGTLPGQKPPTEGWTPAAGVTDFRLLDEF
jgi:predicted acetyltransferase